MPYHFMKLEDYEKEVQRHSARMPQSEMDKLEAELYSELIGVSFGGIISLPIGALPNIEPSQVGTITGTLLDACIPMLETILKDEKFAKLGIQRAPGQIGEREAYPDYEHVSGARLELKLLYVDNASLPIKRPPTKKEPSARLAQKVTFKNVKPDKDCLLVIAYAYTEDESHLGYVVPTIIDLKLFPVIDCIIARDRRLYHDCMGGWFGYFDTPVVLSKVGQKRLESGEDIDYSGYGRKAGEGRDFNEDTNFGKLARIHYGPIDDFIKQCTTPIKTELSPTAAKIIHSVTSF